MTIVTPLPSVAQHIKCAARSSRSVGLGSAFCHMGAEKYLVKVPELTGCCLPIVNNIGDFARRPLPFFGQPPRSFCNRQEHLRPTGRAAAGSLVKLDPGAADQVTSVDVSHARPVWRGHARAVAVGW